MALDGIFLRHIKTELESALIDARVSQVFEPNRDELIINLRTFGGNRRLLLSTRADSPRVGITEYSVENPDKPPMFCMLLRKRLTSSKLISIRQPDLERMLFFDFDCVNELGDKVKLTLAVEIMGKHSNIVLIDGEGIIIDALKRVDVTLSSKRLVLPSLIYEMPPSQEKLSIENTDTEEILKAIKLCPYSGLDKAILNTLTGVSPIICRELSYASTGTPDTDKNLMNNEEWQSLLKQLEILREEAKNPKTYAVTLKNTQGKLFDFSFMPVNQYGDTVEKFEYESFCKALDAFYHTRESLERMRVKSHALSKLVSNNIERLSRKISLQKIELEKCQDREILRQKADLISANMHLIQKGAPFADLINFYDENASTIRITLDVAKTPQQNAQKYYKDYAKAKTADKMLRVQIENSAEELSYLETVADEINRAESEHDLSQIRQELIAEGYLRQNKSEKNNKKPQKIKPDFREFDADGFKVLVGRNNKQNDLLTLKTAQKNDLWLHTKDIPGSHTVIITEGREVPESTILKAAEIAAYFSKAKDSSQVPVDYTLVRRVNKPQGAKPGKVIYTDQKTVYVTPAVPQKK
ncbi:MAG: NFACT family protein [Clostridia bacterium]|nr:NFACT family protein [Clostridia bacterium]